MLEALGRSDVAVYAGLGKPLLDPVAQGRAAIAAHRPAPDGRRSSGIRDRRGPPARHAVDFIVDTVMSGDGDVTLVPIGPLTNIAGAFALEPRMADKARICLMGGCTHRAQPEWNALCDPEAARIVFGTGVPITMVGPGRDRALPHELRPGARHRRGGPPDQPAVLRADPPLGR